MVELGQPCLQGGLEVCFELGAGFLHPGRHQGAHAAGEVDQEPYYIKQALAGQGVVLLVNAPEKLFEVWHEGTLIKQLPIKGLHGAELPFERYVTLMKQEAHSEGRRVSIPRRSFQQLRLWA